MGQMILQRLDGRLFAATLILDQWHKHPAHRGCLVPRTVENILPFDDLLLRSRQRPVGLPITHADLVASIQEIEIRHIQVDTSFPTPVVKIRHTPELVPLRILQPFVAGMLCGMAYIARIGAVVLKDIQARGLEQLVQLPHIGLSPGTLDTRRTAETGLLTGRQHHIILRINMTTGQQ